ncbi:hypothetical protein RF11_10515 [Thelohanellus kitauei]|uniref:Uncharacterized protein n=1 Tax=Thelohanellus kitauei TaxID=669202 RepID=A0A0C2MG44_THEKT|nr:hypothetical protein RF11_10515 [Thelohanellus kitauei]
MKLILFLFASKPTKIIKKQLLEQLCGNNKSKKCLGDVKRAKYDVGRKISIDYIYSPLKPKFLLSRPSSSHGTFLVGIPFPLLSLRISYLLRITVISHHS